MANSSIKSTSTCMYAKWIHAPRSDGHIFEESVALISRKLRHLSIFFLTICCTKLSCIGYIQLPINILISFVNPVGSWSTLTRACAENHLQLSFHFAENLFVFFCSVASFVPSRLVQLQRFYHNAHRVYASSSGVWAAQGRKR